jgi:hypothetical protein
VAAIKVPTTRDPEVVIDIPAPPDWMQRVKGLVASVGYFSYPEDGSQDGWYIDFVLDALPRYFGPFKTEAEARRRAWVLRMVVR